MAMTPLPAAPQRDQDPATFATTADTFVAALPGFVTEANLLQTDVTTKQTAAATSATNAATSATNAANSATAAASSATTASTQATNAANSATSAATQATNAANSATAAASSATSAAANSVLQKYRFNTTTTMADPTTGYIRFNNASFASVTAIAIDAQTNDTGNPNILNWLLTFDDSSSLNKGQLVFSEAGSPTNFAIYNVTSLVNNTGWVQFNVTHVASSGSFALNDTVVLDFKQNGDAGSSLPSLTGNALKFLRVNSGGTAAEWADAGRIMLSSRTSNTILGTSDIGKLIDITSGTFTQTFTAAATLTDGWYCYIRNSGTGDITLDPNNGETIDGLTSFIMYPSEVRLIQCDGTTLRSVVIQGFNKTFIASGNFIKPPGYAQFDGLLWGGGGSGSKGSGTATSGGGGGGACVEFHIQSSTLSQSTSVVIGAGGLAVSTSTTNGNTGGTSSFGVLNSYGGGGGGVAGNSPGGGSGGGALSSGVVGSNTGAVGGSPAGGHIQDTNDVDSSFGGGHGASTTTNVGKSFYGGGGGAVGNSQGGGSVFGGGGGGGGGTSDAQAGGISVFGGSGGIGNSSIAGGDGAAPGGGGGSTRSSTGGINSGAGARGELRIWGVV